MFRQIPWSVLLPTILCILCIHFDLSETHRILPDWSQIQTPPSFIHKPNPDIVYFIVEQNTANNTDFYEIHPDKVFNCEAKGVPNPSYRWYKDDKEIDFDNPSIISRITRLPESGGIILKRLISTDSGFYKCSAENDNGTAFDKPVFLQEAVMDMFVAEPPETVEIKFGDPFEHECVAPRSVPPAKSYWSLCSSHDTERRVFRTINSTNIVVNDKGTIFFQYVTEKDVVPNLFYTCVAENPELRDYKFGSQFMFNVSQNPHRRSLEPSIAPNEQHTSLDKVTVLRGQNLELFCVMSGYPDLIPTWNKENGTLNYSRISWGSNFQKSMKLYGVDFSDAGIYSCDFERAPQLSKKFQVTVEDAPFWIDNEPPKSVNSSETSVAEFNCTAGGIPSNEVSFFKNGQRIVSGDHYTIYGPLLLIKDIRRGKLGRGDNAVYQCNVTNAHGSLWANFYLNIMAYEPVILNDPETVEIVAGRNASLNCTVFGSPKPQVVWSNKFLPKLSAGVHYDLSPVDQLGVSKIKLKNVQKTDAGEYYCNFSNDRGNDASFVRLVVRDQTKFSIIAESQKVAAGKPLKLPCNAYHDPNLQAEYAWTFNKHPIPSYNSKETAQRNKATVYVDSNSHSLIIDELSSENTGNYICQVNTALDSIENALNITVKDVPPAPIDLYVTCAESAAQISFYKSDRQRDASKSDSWVIQLNVDPNEPDAWDDYVGPFLNFDAGMAQSLVHLYPYGNFSIRVLAKNEVGFSEPAYAVKYENDLGTQRCATAPKIPLMHPQNVRLSSTSPDNLVISWDPIFRRDWFGPDFSYFVQYKMKNQSEDEYINVTVTNPYDDSLTINGLPSYQLYDVRVSSKNRLGSPVTLPENIEGFSGEDLPTTFPEGFDVKKIQGSSMATFVWKPIDHATVRGQLKGYKIEYWYDKMEQEYIAVSSRFRRSTSIDLKEAYFDNHAVSGDIFDLKPNTINHATIRVYNNAGEGPRSQIIDIDMPEGVPAPVENLHGFPLSHKEIGAIWSPPKEINGNLTGYRVSLCLHDAPAPCLRTFDIPPDGPLELRIDNLSTDTAYRVEVIAKTLMGAGELNVIDVKTSAVNISAVAPAEPSIAKVQIANTHINVTWKPGDYSSDKMDAFAPADTFYFKFKSQGTNKWQIANHSDLWNRSQPSGFTVTLKDLEPATTYEVRAVSVHYGIKKESQSHYYTTGGGSLRKFYSGWIIALIVMIILLLIVMTIVCLICRTQGDKYSVFKKEKEQGRDVIFKNEKSFGEYIHEPDCEEKASLTTEVKLESETDSMAEYGDGEVGRFTEDGSFIGQYGPSRNIQNNLIMTSRGTSENTRPFTTSTGF